MSAWIKIFPTSSSVSYAGIAVVLIMLAVSVASGQKDRSAVPSLKEVYKAYFPIGVAITPRSVNDGREAEFIKGHFNSITAENAMKMGPIHPEEDTFYWKDADAIVDYALENGMKIRGHTLCWHNQAPKWFFTDSLGKEVTREVLLERLKHHIVQVAGRYKGKNMSGT